jgi:hypothetical protein
MSVVRQLACVVAVASLVIVLVAFIKYWYAVR